MYTSPYASLEVLNPVEKLAIENSQKLEQLRKESPKPQILHQGSLKSLSKSPNDAKSRFNRHKIV